MTDYELIQASAHNTGLPDNSVHCIVTSPPYYGLRAYEGDQTVDWPAVSYAPLPGAAEATIPAMSCGLGQENSPDAFIGHLVLVMREMWRVLRDDGTAWVDLGDTFAGSGGAGGDYAPGGLRDGQPLWKNNYRPGPDRTNGAVGEKGARNGAGGAGWDPR